MPDGTIKGIQVQAVDKLTKPLAAVSRIVSRGNRVVFDEDGSYIQDKKSGKRTRIADKGEAYVLRLRVSKKGSSGF